MNEYEIIDSPKRENISEEDINDLLVYFKDHTYNAYNKEFKAEQVWDRCFQFWKADYNVNVINNIDGELSYYYPRHIIIPESEIARTPTKSPRSDTIYENYVDSNKLQEYIVKSRLARCRTRFPVPVILLKGHAICRSSTISGAKEIYLRSGLEYITGASATSKPTEEINDDEVFGEEVSAPKSLPFMDQIRHHDIALLRYLRAVNIVDLMVEKKKVKYYLNVTSSEKVDKENRYQGLNLLCLPYPGCEFFKTYRDNNYVSRDLKFDWSQKYIDVELNIPNLQNMKVDWSKYKQWDINELTVKYIRYILLHFKTVPSGILIHCISGWDRTPLFVSVIRLCLWAEGLIHQSLGTVEILYFTLAYDWMFFGHHLVDRLRKGEDIMYYAFRVIDKIFEYRESKESPKSEESPTGPAASSRARSVSESGKLDTVKMEVDNKEASPVKEEGVKRMDSELHVDILLDSEHELRGSNVSLSSVSSHASAKFEEQVQSYPEEAASNKNKNNVLKVSDSPKQMVSPLGRRTSPVSIPTTKRQRNDSSSSNVSASWTNLSGSEASITKGSGQRVSDEFINAQDRISEVKKLFIKCYVKSVGLKMMDDKSVTAIVCDKITSYVRS